MSPSPQVIVQQQRSLMSSCAVDVMTLCRCTGPCQPDGLSLTYHCTNLSALLSWTPRPTAVHYYGCAESEGGDMLYCHSAGPTCTIQGLDCGGAYNFSVKASDGACNSSSSNPVLAQAGIHFCKTGLLKYVFIKRVKCNKFTVCLCQFPALQME